MIVAIKWQRVGPDYGWGCNSRCSAKATVMRQITTVVKGVREHQFTGFCDRHLPKGAPVIAAAVLEPKP